MNKKILFIILLGCSFLTTGTSQEFDPDRIILPDDYRPPGFEEYLVQLAWANNPDNKVLDSKRLIAVEELKIKKWSWAEDFQLTFNLNEINVAEFFADPDEEENFFVSFPKYNFGAVFNLGDLIKHPAERRIAEQKLIIADHDINSQKLDIRSDVIQRYNLYLLSIETLKARTQAEDDAYQTYLLVSDLFRNKEATFEEFNSASTAYHKAKEGRIIATSDIEISKIKLEQLIGVKLDSAENTSGFFRKKKPSSSKSSSSKKSSSSRSSSSKNKSSKSNK